MKTVAGVRDLLARRFAREHRKWIDGALAANAYADNQANSPQASPAPWAMTINLDVPNDADASGDVNAVRQWIAGWSQCAMPGDVSWTERRWRHMGKQCVPERLCLSSPGDIATWAGAAVLWATILWRAVQVVKAWPRLAGTVADHYAILADYGAQDYDLVFVMVNWLAENPASGFYPRQLPVLGVDGKWLESRKGAIMRLLCAVQGRVPGTDFHETCGLKALPATLRIRLLDPELRRRCGGLGDITAPVADLAQLDIGVTTVLIVENLQSGLPLPDLPGTAAIMALGYGVEALARLPWVAAAGRAVYWGDLDTHGFAILNRARTHVPHLRSILMDAATLHRHQPLWGEETRPHGALEFDRLTPEEHLVYDWFKSASGANRRMEQERVSWDWAMERIQGEIG